MFIQWAAFKLKRLSPSTMSFPPTWLTHEAASVAYETGRVQRAPLAKGYDR